MKPKLLDVDFVIATNKFVCDLEGQSHICAKPEKIESVLHSSFYPGSAPYVHGGIPGIAAALFFYIVKAHAFFDGNKRTAVVCAIAFMKRNKLTLKYPVTDTRNDLATLAEASAASEIDLPEIKKWFASHKVKYQKI